MDTFYETGKLIACGAGIITEIVAIYAIVKNFILKRNKADSTVEKFPEVDENVKKCLNKIHEMSEIVYELRKNVNDITEKLEDNSDLTLSIARDRLLTVLSKVMENHCWDSVVEFRVISKLYDSYIANGGNSEIVAMYIRCKDYQIKE